LHRIAPLQTNDLKAYSGSLQPEKINGLVAAFYALTAPFFDDNLACITTMGNIFKF